MTELYDIEVHSSWGGGEHPVAQARLADLAEPLLEWLDREADEAYPKPLGSSYRITHHLARVDVFAPNGVHVGRATATARDRIKLNGTDEELALTDAGARMIQAIQNGEPVERRDPPHIYVEHEINAQGRDFAVGDIHATFHKVEALLEQVAFEPSRDRLFVVGDLIDRGHEEDRLSHFVGQDWFHSIRGNHEQMALDGQPWSETLSSERTPEMLATVQALPFLRKVATDQGNVGFVHARVPDEQSWTETVEAIATGRNGPRGQLLWHGIDSSYVTQPSAVAGVAWVICGHHVVSKPDLVQNYVNIDTGGHSWTMTMIQFHPGPWRYWCTKDGKSVEERDWPPESDE